MVTAIGHTLKQEIKSSECIHEQPLRIDPSSLAKNIVVHQFYGKQKEDKNCENQWFVLLSKQVQVP